MILGRTMAPASARATEKEAGLRIQMLATFLPRTQTMTPEVVIGRWLAFCVHPTAAWRRLPLSGRCLMAASYAAASYAAGLSMLLLLS